MNENRKKIIILSILAICICIFCIIFTPSRSPSSDFSSAQTAEESYSPTAPDSEAPISESSDTQVTEPDENSQQYSTKSEDVEESDIAYAGGHIVLEPSDKFVAETPYLPTVASIDDQRYTFPQEAKNRSEAARIEKYAVALFPYSPSECICSYADDSIDGRTMRFYEFYDKSNYNLLCIWALNGKNNYLYNSAENSYTPIIVR